jgi:hypothetical protein
VQHRSRVLTGGGWGSPGGKPSTRGSPTAPRTLHRGQDRRARHGRPARRRGMRLTSGSAAAPRWGAWFTSTLARVSLDAHTELRSGNQRRGPRRRGGVIGTCTQTKHADRFAGETHGDGELKDMEGPGATSRRGRPQAHQAILRPSPERASAWPQPCLRTRGLAVPLGAALW